jgi:hypothetical protein
MSEDRILSSLGSLAQVLSQSGGYEPKRLRGLSRQGPDLVSSLIEAILCSDEDRMQRNLVGLADYLSGKISSTAWFNLGQLAASLFFRRAAEEYFEKRETVMGGRRPGYLWAASAVMMRTGIAPVGSMSWL